MKNSKKSIMNISKKTNSFAEYNNALSDKKINTKTIEGLKPATPNIYLTGWCKEFYFIP